MPSNFFISLRIIMLGITFCFPLKIEIRRERQEWKNVFPMKRSARGGKSMSFIPARAGLRWRREDEGAPAAMCALRWSENIKKIISCSGNGSSASSLWASQDEFHIFERIKADDDGKDSRWKFCFAKFSFLSCQKLCCHFFLFAERATKSSLTST